MRNNDNTLPEVIKQLFQLDNKETIQNSYISILLYKGKKNDPHIAFDSKIIINIDNPDQNKIN